MSTLQQIFARNGPLAKQRGGLETRPGQLAMAQTIATGIEHARHTLVEAGTGVGKSFGYLIPALLSGKRIVLSTGTVALQEQLLYQDLPVVTKALGIAPKITLLKGRSHYLCRDKFERSSTAALFAPTASLDDLWNWATKTKTGDRSELTTVPLAHEWETLDADADDCVGELCGNFRTCFYFHQRDAARDSQIVIVNHALFFLDLVNGGILPPFDVAVLDEAHQCEHWATQALTGSISEKSIGRILRRLRTSYPLPSEIEGELMTNLRSLHAVIDAAPQERYALDWDQAEPFIHETAQHLAELHTGLRRLENWLETNGIALLRQRTANEEEATRRRDLALRRLRAPIATLEQARRPSNESIVWLERHETTRALHTAPFSVADMLREKLFSRIGSVVLTSATLAEAGSFSYVRRVLGIDAAQELVADSPFDFAKQACLYVAPAAVNPKERDFIDHAVPIIAETLTYTRGRAFLLFTSFGRMHEMHKRLAEIVPFPLRMQGELSRSALLEWFADTPQAVLCATGAFWEGIDVVGDALSCVIVDRLPFPSPTDPLVAARITELEKKGINGFTGYMIPAATTRLKQGFGRLIRSQADRGVLVLLDGRAASTRYGQKILQALPPARRIRQLSEIEDFFSAGARA